MKAIVGKRYRHYKGNEYTVIALARNEANPKEISVIYRAEYDSPDFGEACVWQRSIESFEEIFTMDGHMTERFMEIG